MIHNITDQQIQKFPLKAKRYRRGLGKGLGILIRPDGGKSWNFRFRVDKKEQSICFGVYPEVSIEEAWMCTLKAREQLRNGILPNEQRRIDKATIVYNNKIVRTTKATKDSMLTLIRLQKLVDEAKELFKISPSEENLNKLEDFMRNLKIQL